MISPRFPQILAVLTTGFLLMTLPPAVHANDAAGGGLTRDNVPPPGKVDKNQYNLFTLAQQVDVGLRWRPIKSLQLDAGCNFGLSRAAPDYQWFSGVSTRF